LANNKTKFGKVDSRKKKGPGIWLKRENIAFVICLLLSLLGGETQRNGRTKKGGGKGGKVGRKTTMQESLKSKRKGGRFSS